MKLLLLSLSLSLCFVSAPTLAHEGHNMPGTIKAIHGGIPKAGKLFNMEMLTKGKTIQFFPVPHPTETVDASKVKISGTAKTPKGKPVNLKFTLQDKSFVTEVDFEGSHRINLDIKVEMDGNSDIFKFLVEK